MENKKLNYNSENQKDISINEIQKNEDIVAINKYVNHNYHDIVNSDTLELHLKEIDQEEEKEKENEKALKHYSNTINFNDSLYNINSTEENEHLKSSLLRELEQVDLKFETSKYEEAKKAAEKKKEQQLKLQLRYKTANNEFDYKKFLFEVREELPSNDKILNFSFDWEFIKEVSF